MRRCGVMIYPEVKSEKDKIHDEVVKLFDPLAVELTEEVKKAVDDWKRGRVKK